MNRTMAEEMTHEEKLAADADADVRTVGLGPPPDANLVDALPWAE